MILFCCNFTRLLFISEETGAITYDDCRRCAKYVLLQACLQEAQYEQEYYLHKLLCRHVIVHLILLSCSILSHNGFAFDFLFGSKVSQRF